MTAIPNSLGQSRAVEPSIASPQARDRNAQPTGKVYVIPASDVPGDKDGPPDKGRLAEMAYRGAEIVIASAGLILGAPLMLLAAVMIRLESPGPVMFRHRRPGRSTLAYGRELEGRADLHPPPGGYRPDALYYVPSYFTLAKFRTMYHDSQERFPGYYAYAFPKESFHQQYPTPKGDPRVTRVGGMLRKLSVDELPNFWSVLKGELRLVGPRPEAPEVLQYYRPDEMQKFTRTPGITGLAQVSGRGFLNWGETIRYDLEYVRTRTIALDLRIIFLTIKRVVSRHGAF